MSREFQFDAYFKLKKIKFQYPVIHSCCVKENMSNETDLRCRESASHSMCDACNQIVSTFVRKTLTIFVRQFPHFRVVTFLRKTLRSLLARHDVVGRQHDGPTKSHIAGKSLKSG